MTAPTEQGYYWASSNGKCWDVIAEIWGRAPFLRIRAFSVTHMEIIDESRIKAWAPRIEEPDDMPKRAGVVT